MSKLLARQRKLSACSFKHQLLDLSFINCFFFCKILLQLLVTKIFPTNEWVSTKACTQHFKTNILNVMYCIFLEHHPWFLQFILYQLLINLKSLRMSKQMKRGANRWSSTKEKYLGPNRKFFENSIWKGNQILCISSKNYKYMHVH